MATAVLQSRELPPARPTITQSDYQIQGVPNVEIVYAGNAGNDMGISTMGYRVGKFNPPEWHESNYAKYYQSFIDRDNGERIRHESKRTMNETAATTDQTQSDSTKRLAERLHDVNFWKHELEREIQDVIEETDRLIAQKDRLENAYRATEIPLHISTDNLNCRQRRYGIDLVQDEPEIRLLKEVDIINNVQDLLRKAIDQSEKQIKLNRDAKQTMELDWSDKLEAHEIDKASGALRNGDTSKMYHPGAAVFQEIQSTPESWAQFTHDNIVRAEHERMASIQLRTMIDNILDDTSRDMREQADSVDVAMSKRIDEMQDAKHKMEENLKKTVKEVQDMEKNIADLDQAIKDKENPMKVVQTRLYNRTFRPGVEMCRDAPQHKLIGEVNEISQSIDALMEKRSIAAESLKELQDLRMSLEREITMKKNSLFIDREKVMTVRNRYPTTLRLQGFNR